MKRRHTREELALLLGVADAPPVAVAPPRKLEPVPAPPATAAECFAVWSAARAEANLAYDAWCARPGGDGYAAYRAAEDRADAAEASFAAAA